MSRGVGEERSGGGGGRTTGTVGDLPKEGETEVWVGWYGRNVGVGVSVMVFVLVRSMRGPVGGRLGTGLV